MSKITIKQSVGELVAERPGRSRIFEDYGIDFCCGGKLPLEEACAKKQVPVEEVVRKLLDLDESNENKDELIFATMPLDALADHIEAKHHEHLRIELPRLQRMAERVAKVHGDKDERLGQLESVLNNLIDELMSHMMKEEQILFPVVRQMVQSTTAVTMPCGSLSGPISQMEHEHDNAGDALETIKTLTDSYTPPHDACNTYRALFDGLRELELDMHQHIHKENSILFPRALALESKLNN